MDPVKNKNSRNSADPLADRISNGMDGENQPSKPVTNHPDAVQSSTPPEDNSQEPLPKIEPISHDYHKQPRSKKPLLIALIILAVVAAAVYWFVLRAEPATAPTPSDGSTTSSQNNNEVPATDTKHHDSTNFNLGFDYPSSWTVVEDEDAETEQISVISPKTKLQDAAGEEVDGQIIMYIVGNAETLKELDDKKPSTAILDSEKITYEKPTETQRGDTYLSFLNYATSTSDGIDGIYITGDNGYKKDQAIPKTDILKSDPIIRVVFNECPESSNCKELGTPITISAEMWSDSEFSSPIKNMLESLAIQ